MEAVAFERRRLGRTELQVPVLGIGGAHLGDRPDGHHEQVAVDTVLAGLEAGIDLIEPEHANGARGGARRRGT